MFILLNSLDHLLDHCTPDRSSSIFVFGSLCSTVRYITDPTAFFITPVMRSADSSVPFSFSLKCLKQVAMDTDLKLLHFQAAAQYITITIRFPHGFNCLFTFDDEHLWF